MGWIKQNKDGWDGMRWNRKSTTLLEPGTFPRAPSLWLQARGIAYCQKW